MPSARDILDDANTTVQASSDAFGSWVSTVGSPEVVVSGQFMSASVGIIYYVQESRDGTNVLQEFQLSATSRSHVPGSAFIRVRINNANTYAVPLAYSLRSIG